MRVPFGEWLPDVPALDSPGATIATNVVPAAIGYRSLRSLAYIDSTGTGVTLTGAYAAKDPNGSFLFAGSAAKLWRYASAGANYEDVSGTATYSNAEWRFTTFGSRVIAAGGDSTDTQYFDMTGSTDFATLPGSPPRARFIATVRDFVMMAYVTYGGSTYPRRARWSGVDDSEHWTIGLELSDFQDLADAGVITGLHGGEDATLLCERGIYRGWFTGEAETGGWQFDRVLVDRGNKYPGASAKVETSTFFLSDDGFYELAGLELRPIGEQKVNRWFSLLFDVGKSDQITCAVDATRKVCVWAFTSVNSPDGFNDMLLIYHYVTKRWSVALDRADILFQLYQPAVSLEGITAISPSIDDLQISLDDPSLRGGQLSFAGTRGDRVRTFSGTPMEGVVETAEFGEWRRSLIRRVMPLTEGAMPEDVTVQIASRLAQQDEIVFGSEAVVGDDGWFPTRELEPVPASRYHRIRCTIGGERWTTAHAVEVDAVPLGLR